MVLITCINSTQAHISRKITKFNYYEMNDFLHFLNNRMRHCKLLQSNYNIEFKKVIEIKFVTINFYIFLICDQLILTQQKLQILQIRGWTILKIFNQQVYKITKN
jgi:hypothetical protein